MQCGTAQAIGRVPRHVGHHSVELADDLDTDTERPPLFALHEEPFMALDQHEIDTAIGPCTARFFDAIASAREDLADQPTEVRFAAAAVGDDRSPRLTVLATLRSSRRQRPSIPMTGFEGAADIASALGGCDRPSVW